MYNLCSTLDFANENDSRNYSSSNHRIPELIWVSTIPGISKSVIMWFAKVWVHPWHSVVILSMIFLNIILTTLDGILVQSHWKYVILTVSRRRETSNYAVLREIPFEFIQFLIRFRSLHYPISLFLLMLGVRNCTKSDAISL